jgi:hypothetical protein
VNRHNTFSRQVHQDIHGTTSQCTSTLSERSQCGYPHSPAHTGEGLFTERHAKVGRKCAQSTTTSCRNADKPLRNPSHYTASPRTSQSQTHVSKWMHTPWIPDAPLSRKVLGCLVTDRQRSQWHSACDRATCLFYLDCLRRFYQTTCKV